MAMQIQRGLVKYKDRSDIICTYGVSPTGMQYYFLDESRLPNGNIIVTTTLLEAVDPVVIASHVGVIDVDGNVVIDCVNKSIKPISSDILLVEKAQPTSQNVLDSIRLREDPTAATKLVTTPATIKDNINNSMDSNGRFVFNDQFSEATIYDINGNNLINDELYSFIGLDNKKIYFSKNTIDSPVIEYPLYPVDEDESNEQPKLNIETTDINKDIIEKAIDDELESNEEEVEETTYEENTDIDNIKEAEEVSVEEKNSDKVEETYEEKITYEENTDIDNIKEAEGVTEKAYSENDDIVKEDANSEKDNTTESAIPEVEENVIYEEENIIPDVDDTSIDEERIPLNIGTEQYEDSEDNKKEVTTEEDNKGTTVEESVVSEVLDNTYTEEDKFSGVSEEKAFEESVEEDDTNDSDETEGGDNTDIDYQEHEDYTEDDLDNPVYVEDSYDYGYEEDLSYNNLVESYNYQNNNTLSQKNIFDDVTITISNLVELNRNLQSMVDSYDIKLAKCDASRKKLLELSKSQAREISSLNARIARLESDKEVLENKLNALTPAANGDLVRAMADAHNILGQSNRLRRNNNY